MQDRSPKHQARHPYSVDPAYDYQVSFSTYEFVPQRLIHTLPSSSIYETSNGFAVISPEPRHRKEVRGDGYERAHQNVDAEVDEFIKYEQKKVRVVDYDRAGDHAAYGGNSKVSGEDVNSEADGFIRHAHERFLRKSRSVNYG